MTRYLKRATSAVWHVVSENSTEETGPTTVCGLSMEDCTKYNLQDHLPTGQMCKKCTHERETGISLARWPELVKNINTLLKPHGIRLRAVRFPAGGDCLRVWVEPRPVTPLPPLTKGGGS